MAGDLKRYMDEILVTNAEKERLENEMEIARAIQQSFLPETISQVEGFDVAAKSLMAKEVGGDFFDVIPFEVVKIKPGRMGVLIADVSGKGIPAALFMALSRIIVRVNATWFYDEPARAIHDANNLIAADSKAGMFVTLFYGILDHTSHTFTYVNAGHNPPIVYHGSDGTFSELAATGIAMGVITDAEYLSNEQPLSPGDVVVLYTDGITEAMNVREEMFGEERLYAVIRGTKDLSAGKILATILDAVREFTGDYPQSDDITLMVVRVV
jgi:sigma-B regulation protein RsbU (phosphoserine phosphatase)